jgi:hypothetical protein
LTIDFGISFTVTGGELRITIDAGGRADRGEVAEGTRIVTIAGF